jgi:hypothetical protein
MHIQTPRARLGDASDCGRFARDLVREAFQTRRLDAYRDHEQLVAHWRSIPGFLAGYVEPVEVKDR